MNIFKEYKPVIVLIVICVVASGSLAITQVITSPIVEANRKAREKEAIMFVLPGITSYEEKTTPLDKRYFEGVFNGQQVGYAIHTQVRGHRGPINILVGFSKDGRIFNIRIIEHRETPGLGSRITEPHFTEQFKDRDVADINLETIQAITGATISFRAVVDGVREQVKEFLEKK
jgi:electron transport complex protein RnfG